MAVTSGKKKARLDYSALIDQAISSDDSKETTEVLKEEVTAPEIEVHSENAGNVVKPAKKAAKKAQNKAPKENEKKKNNDISDSLDAKFSFKQKGRGVQKSVYLEEDVHKYIQSKCDKYNIKYSQVLNEILREAIKLFKKRT